jgi:pimeloyl-ACP methyl ester carboxylesterase
MSRLRAAFHPQTALGSAICRSSSAALRLAIMFRTRFKDEIVAEFLPPVPPREKAPVIIVCDGMPVIPIYQGFCEFLAGQGFWVVYPRWRGSWESGGEFMARSPVEDVLDVIDELPNGLVEIAFGRHFAVEPDEIYVIGESFSGAAAILASLDARVTKVVANCPVTDWSILDHSEQMETANLNFAAYVREAFGHAYRVSDENWSKLRGGNFFSPWAQRAEFKPGKVLIIHAKDDIYVRYAPSERFARATGVQLHTIEQGGHLSAEWVVKKYWEEIKKFFESE